MKSIKELEAIREKALQSMQMREGGKETRIVVGMATCGISAGARPVLKEFMNEINARQLSGVEVCQTGCVGLCSLEPIVEVYQDGKDKVTYGKVTPEIAKKIVQEHITNGKVVEENTVAVLEQQG